MKKKFKIILSIIVFLLITSLSVAGYFYLGIILPGNHETDKTNFINKVDFKVESGEGVKKIGDNLFEKKLIKNKLIFETYLRLRGWQGDIKAGEYRLSRDLNIRELVNILRLGKVKGEIKIRIIEGKTIEDIGDYLAENEVVAKDAWLQEVKNPKWFMGENLQKYPFLKEVLLRDNLQNSFSLEGYLFPDTYIIYKDATVEDIVRKMLDNFSQKITPDLLDEIAKQNKNLDEVLRLASIVEKEVATYEDRRMVADIFLKRLKIGMALQSDATVNYVTKKGTTRPSFEDLAVESAYNTYQNKGLPPTPINNPSLSAIKAVIYPLANDYYFFLTDKDGGVHYGRNGDEHNLNRQKYLE